jgi:hypothetical protein
MIAADKELVTAAKSTLKRLMCNSNDPKLARQTAIDILEIAGEKQPNKEAVTKIEISDSNIQLAVKVIRELKEGE